MTCNADIDTGGVDLATCSDDFVAANADLAALQAEMRCPVTGVCGTFTPTAPNLVLSGSQTSANTFEGFQDPSPNCSGLRLEWSLAFDNDCDTMTGTLECIAPGSTVVFSATAALERQ